LAFQEGGSLGAYEAGGYKDINEDLESRREGKRTEGTVEWLKVDTSVVLLQCAVKMIRKSQLRDYKPAACAIAAGHSYGVPVGNVTTSNVS
jgi:hypothetical protein